MCYNVRILVNSGIRAPETLHIIILSDTTPSLGNGKHSREDCLALVLLPCCTHGGKSILQKIPVSATHIRYVFPSCMGSVGYINSCISQQSILKVDVTNYCISTENEGTA